MEAIPYKLRLQSATRSLGRGQRRVSPHPAFDTAEIDNSFSPAAERHCRALVLNMALGAFPCGNGGFPSGMPSGPGMDITFSNELDDGYCLATAGTPP